MSDRSRVIVNPGEEQQMAAAVERRGKPPMPGEKLVDLRRAYAELQRRLDDPTAELQARTAEREALQRELVDVGAQQAATSEVLQVINSSPGDLAPVFDAMLEKAMRLCEASFGMLQTYDGERFEAAALRGLPPAYAEFLSGNPPRSGPGTAPARFLAGEEVVRIADLKTEDAYWNGDLRRRAMVDLGGARSSAAVALRSPSLDRVARPLLGIRFLEEGANAS